MAVFALESEPTAALPILLSSILLGSLVGLLAEKTITG